MGHSTASVQDVATALGTETTIGHHCGMAAAARPVPSVGQMAATGFAALAAGAGVAALVLSSEHFADAGVYAVFGPVVGWSFVGTGLYAWRRRPESRFGMLMVALGLTWFLAPLNAAESPLIFTLGIPLGSVWGAVFIHTLVTFPSGHLETPSQRRVVLAAYAIVCAGFLPVLLFVESDTIVGCDGPCPRNVLRVSEQASVGEALLAVEGLLVVGICVLVISMQVVRWRRAGPPERRTLAPIFATGGAALALAGLYVVSDLEIFNWLFFAATALIPPAFLAGLAGSDVARSRRVRDFVGQLGDPRAHEDLRRTLSETLGDPSLELAYWLPGERRWVGAAGEPLALPGDAAAFTEVRHSGRRVAAILHDPALADQRATISAVGTAAGLMLENRRLDAELLARLEDLRASRARLVAAGDAERRRLERNLHDGAQSRLVALALQLRLAHDAAPEGSDMRARLNGALDELRTSLQELRELARGIHPAVLSERGLAPAIEMLAKRAGVPVELDVTLTGRASAAAETAAYYVVAEALTNVSKYAQAESASVRARQEDGRLVVEVSDDGVGGADAAAGSGLRGLVDRVGAIDGTLEVTSPPGRGTYVRAELPCT
jgi:signal transduction histidine kinase